ncbi:MAG: hypothetical protein KKE23_02330, partial [Nanoarchaeota archaeon]|nr:hypothetical protein [Nanoarchaeota archaeon]
DAIKFRLEDLTELGEDATLDFEKGFHIEKFSKVLQHGPRLGLGYEQFNLKEKIVKEYFNLQPEILMSFFDPKNYRGNFVALRAKEVELMRASPKKLGDGIILIYPKGSQYSSRIGEFNILAKSHLLDIIGNFKDFYL